MESAACTHLLMGGSGMGKSKRTTLKLRQVPLAIFDMLVEPKEFFSRLPKDSHFLDSVLLLSILMLAHIVLRYLWFMLQFGVTPMTAMPWGSETFGGLYTSLFLVDLGVLPMMLLTLWLAAWLVFNALRWIEEKEVSTNDILLISVFSTAPLAIFGETLVGFFVPIWCFYLLWRGLVAAYAVNVFLAFFLSIIMRVIFFPGVFFIFA